MNNEINLDEDLDFQILQNGNKITYISIKYRSDEYNLDELKPSYNTITLSNGYIKITSVDSDDDEICNIYFKLTDRICDLLLIAIKGYKDKVNLKE